MQSNVMENKTELEAQLAEEADEREVRDEKTRVFAEKIVAKLNKHSTQELLKSMENSQLKIEEECLIMRLCALTIARRAAEGK